MLLKFWCWLWGHNNIVKAATGKQFETYHRLYPDVKVKENYYVLQRLPFCKRCGKKIDGIWEAHS